MYAAGYVVITNMYHTNLIPNAYNSQQQDRQRAKKVVSDSQGLVDFAIGLMIFVLNLPNGQVLFSNYRRIVINPADQKGF